ncbi:hypothetical protein ASPVEDRAFT_895034 [Aspergillus versicolor CBS 583.65]|uniref:NAD-dependent epimerase/dehydratase domain-containing protein n=1 Tax=Aspergillus versicolor CBS 583.65 TaxID=1036611 RepID=A0A1L9PW91_ASPVE|nr:uncharacterized protein ASPVEDRAFT_895034 [Aspergillus versicolor CBS 583.65]OJJ05814.1 hypothetical protein ASPVEDRAFT_895034 [Aspergillus versicolor CBS 583.65]
MPETFDSVIPNGSWVLVTGVNGYVASHTADQLLQHGYKVRGTVRNTTKNQWIKDLFDRKYGAGCFELGQVEDMTSPGAFDHAVKGVWGVVHVATIFGQTPDLISQVVDTNRNLLASAAGETTIKRFVYTSSSEAAVFTSSHEHRSTERTNITIDTWNEEALRRIKEGSTQGPKGGFDMYAASKTLGEQAIWQWVDEHRPGFVVNTVLPSVCFGSSVEPKLQGHASSSAWPAAIFSNKFDQVWPFIQHIIPTGAYCVDTQDVALLHLAGLTLPNVENERLFAFGTPFTWNEVIWTFQKEFPDRQLPAALTFPSVTGTSLNITQDARAQELLNIMGKSGWSSLEEMLMANIADMIQAD